MTSSKAGAMFEVGDGEGAFSWWGKYIFLFEFDMSKKGIVSDSFGDFEVLDLNIPRSKLNVAFDESFKGAPF